VEFRIGSYRDQTCALVDTGFTGGLALPESMLSVLQGKVGPPDGEVVLELANGQKIFSPFYIGSVKLAKIGHEVLCHIYLLGNESLVGLKALQGLAIIIASVSIITFDF